ncbi:MAG: hypothetical protein JNL11_16585 [Bdellovibrionaceae bacterium]|nr:hypothetical protein [Pseudobdellovibrionaceae bacterium]
MKIIALFVLFFSPLAFSYHVIGNGGFAVVCNQLDQKKYYILEEYEAEFNKKIAPLPENNKNASTTIHWAKSLTIAGQVAEYIKRVDTKIQDKLNTYYNNMNIEFVDSLDIDNFNDTNITLAHPSCTLNLVAYQIQKSFAYRPHVFIDRWVWEKLTLNQQGLLIFHEVVYGHMVIDVRNRSIDFNPADVREFIINQVLLKSETAPL